MAETKSKDTVKLSLIAVSAENATLSGKYMPATPMKEISLLQKADAGTALDATVVGAHDFGKGSYRFITHPINILYPYTLEYIHKHIISIHTFNPNIPLELVSYSKHVLSTHPVYPKHTLY